MLLNIYSHFNHWRYCSNILFNLKWFCSFWHSLLWCRNERDGVSNHQPHNCLLNWLFRHRSKKTSKLCVTGLCEGNSPMTGEFPAQRANNAENVSIWWHHHVGRMACLDEQWVKWFILICFQNSNSLTQQAVNCIMPHDKMISWSWNWS